MDQHAQRHSRLSRLVFRDLRLTDGRLKCQVLKAKSTRQKAARCALFSPSHPSLQDPNISTAHLGMVIFEIQGKMFSMFMFKPPRSILAWLRLVLLPSTFLFLGVNQFVISDLSCQPWSKSLRQGDYEFEQTLPLRCWVAHRKGEPWVMGLVSHRRILVLIVLLNCFGRKVYFWTHVGQRSCPDGLNGGSSMV